MIYGISALTASAALRPLINYRNLFQIFESFLLSELCLRPKSSCYHAKFWHTLALILYKFNYQDVLVLSLVHLPQAGREKATLEIMDISANIFCTIIALHNEDFPPLFRYSTNYQSPIHWERPKREICRRIQTWKTLWRKKR